MIMKSNLERKLDKENATTLIKFDGYVILTNSAINIIFPLKIHFGAIRKCESGCGICKGNICINSSFLSYQNEIRTKNLKHSSNTIALSKSITYTKTY